MSTGGAPARPARPARAPKRPAKPKPKTKSELVSALAERAELSRPQVAAVFAAYEELALGELRAGRGVLVPGLAKLEIRHRKAKPGGTGTNPFTGQPMVRKATPAHDVVAARVVRAVRTMLQ